MVKILVIEDEKMLLDDILHVLSMEGYEGIGAANGLVGVQMARENLPDLIVCDIMMPQMDGYGVLDTLRNDSMTAVIPFIFLTAQGGAMARREGMQRGADDFLTKPFTYKELLTTIRVRLLKKEALEKERLRLFSRRLVEVQESERRRIASELHNHFYQALNGLKFLMNPQIQGNHLDGRLAEAQILIDEMIGRVETITLDLYPAMLDQLGLLPALLAYCDYFTSQTQMQVDFYHAGLERRFGSAVETAAYRIVQEAMLNASKYASVSHITLRIWCEDNMLRLHVEDEGAGFHLEKSWLEGKSAGLSAMQERAQILGGQVVIDSELGAGTRVMAAIPYTVYPDSTPTEEVHKAVPVVSQAESQTSIKPGVLPGKIRVLLAEDYMIFRQGLRSLLDAETDLEIIGETGDGLAVFSMVERLKPNVLLLDLNLPGLNGLDIAYQVSRHFPQVKILILSLYSDEAYVVEALRNGATGYMLKGTTGPELAEAVRSVNTGKRYLSPPLSASALDLYQNTRQGRGDTLDSYSTLTSREREVLHLVAEGFKNTEIAERLFISPRTAEAHRANLMRKLGLRTQADLIRYAVQRGIIASE